MRPPGVSALVLCCVVSCVSTARAGGLDIPTLYGARYAAMGGTATAQVDEASAVFHNPAGLAHVESANTTANLSVFVANLQTSPDFINQNVSTGDQVGPTALLAGAYRLHHRVVLGLAAYPVGAAGGRFEYVSERGGEQRQWLNQQTALAVELSPAVGLDLTDALKLGVGYRITALKFERQLGDRSDPRDVNIDLWGYNFAGVRLGLQWSPVGDLQIGAVYRHQVTVTATADEGKLLGFELQDIEGTLTVPAKLSLGARQTVGSLSLALGFDYIRNSQFEEIRIQGKLPDQADEIDVSFAFNWRDSVTVKLGGELVVTPTWRARAGYAFDSQVTNRAYPTSFGSPPTDNHYATLGGGYQAADFRVDLALVHRFVATADVGFAEVADAETCRFCAAAGRYRSRHTSVHADFSQNF